ncbi:DEAD/DEAH box helicase, putative [Eimeria acervulina]|uniref:RNA helicase n=1 Tax=Eimeria acervulina TaxID=5801 RepID=U6GGB5_EIMAC|nr:DEAD/DEAH box helicase, putative [Eimeria acervulina]CDI79296.1 DEAD/DEAH box helicase, putative [Eimeria acervulina]
MPCGSLLGPGPSLVRLRPAAAAAAAAAAKLAATPSRRLLSSSSAAAAAAATAEAARAQPSPRGPRGSTEGKFQQQQQHQQQQQDWQQQQQLQRQLQQQAQQQQQQGYDAFLPADDPWYGSPSEPLSPPPPQQQQQQQQQQWRPSAATAAAGGAGASLRPVNWSQMNLPPIHPVAAPAAAAAATAAAAAAGGGSTTSGEGGAAAATAASAAAAAAPDSLERLGIKLEGREPLPALLPCIAAANLSPLLQQALRDLSFTSLFPVQQIGWPCCFSGRDLIAIAQTGSGKTIGFLIPAIMHLLKQQQQQQQQQQNGGSSSSSSSSSSSGTAPTVLILGPTRELVLQIHSECQRILKATATAAAAAAAAATGTAAAPTAKPAGAALARSVAVYGGASRQQQILLLRAGCDIAVCTPGRLLDLLDASAADLSNVSFVVLDEADRMMDMGFEPQIRKVLSQIRPDRQLVLWSATWPNEVQALARDFCREDFIKVQIGGGDLRANPNIKQVVEVIPSRSLHTRCLELLQQQQQQQQKSIVFCQTKRLTEQLARELRYGGIKAAALHGDKTQKERAR